jgi:hypothetical protein
VHSLDRSWGENLNPASNAPANDAGRSGGGKEGSDTRERL